MAKLTKEQRVAEQAVAKAAADAARQAEFPDVVWDLLLRVEAAGGTVSVIAREKFEVTLVDKYNDTTIFQIGMDSTPTNESVAGAIEWIVYDLEIAINESKRKAAVRQSAISKLSKEEREELGL
jgi:hypothetical protein